MRTKHSVRMLGALALIALLCAGTAPAEEPRGRLRGELKTRALEPIPGATVVATRAEAPPLLALTTTNERGALSLDGLPLGTFDVRARAEGFRAERVEGIALRGPFRTVVDMRADAGPAPPLALSLPASEGALRARVVVVDPRDQPLSGVLVELSPVGHRADPARARTSPGGDASLGPLEPGRWRVALSRAGWSRLVVPDLEWRGGTLTVLARMLPRETDTPTPLEDLLPQAEFLEPGPS